MIVKWTDAFKTIFEAETGTAIAGFALVFGQWKHDWPKQEFSNMNFGRDGAYVHPKVGDQKYKLRHVHLKPIQDQSALRQWLIEFARLGMKRSDRHLIYAHNSRGDYLLIAILPEPDAHNIANMVTAAHKRLMEAFAEVAAAFMEDGSIIA